MTQQIRVWGIDEANQLTEVARSKLDLEERLEDWIEEDVGIVNEDLMVIGRQVATDYGKYVDLLCLNRDADVVILELKRHKTPREITAQALDYASWVVDLSYEQVAGIADKYLRAKGRPALPESFEKRFGLPLPETVNEAHHMMIVAAEIDPSSERIIEYLSRHQGVSINAVTFQHFSESPDRELLARVFLLDPEEVEQKVGAKGTSKRRRNLTLEEFEDIAAEKGVGELFGEAMALLSPLFIKYRRFQSNVSFVGEFRGSRSAMVNLIPPQSSDHEGLAFQVYSLRLAERFGVAEDEIREALPSASRGWSYVKTDDEQYRGFQGHFSDANQVKRLVHLLAGPGAVSQ